MEPIGSPPGSLEQNQDNRRLDKNPEIVIPDVQIEDEAGADGLQGFRCLELKVRRIRLDVALFIVGKQDQVVAIVAVQSLSGMPLLEDEPLNMVDAQIRIHVFPGTLFARTEHLP